MLMKGSSKRKSTKVELEEVKQEDEAPLADVQGYLIDVKRLKQEQAEMLALSYRMSRTSPRCSSRWATSPTMEGR